MRVTGGGGGGGGGLGSGEAVPAAARPLEHCDWTTANFGESISCPCFIYYEVRNKDLKSV